MSATRRQPAPHHNKSISISTFCKAVIPGGKADRIIRFPSIDIADNHSANLGLQTTIDTEVSEQAEWHRQRCPTAPISCMRVFPIVGRRLVRSRVRDD